MIYYIFQGAGQDKLGIFIKSIVQGGAANVVSIIAQITKVIMCLFASYYTLCFDEGRQTESRRSVTECGWQKPCGSVTGKVK